MIKLDIDAANVIYNQVLGMDFATAIDHYQVTPGEYLVDKLPIPIQKNLARHFHAMLKFIRESMPQDEAAAKAIDICDASVVPIF